MNNRIVHWSHNHKRSLIFLTLVLAIIGLIFSRAIPVSLFPQVNFPRIAVAIDVGDIPANQMVNNVTRPLEEAIRAVQGVQSLRSTSSRGSAEISVAFNWSQNMIEAEALVQGAISQIRDVLPPSLHYEIRRMDPTIFPVMALSLSSESASLTELRDIATFDIVPRVSAVQGLAKATVTGGTRAEYRIETDPDKLLALGLNQDDVSAAIAANNLLQSEGRIQQQYKLFLLMADAQLQTLDDIRNTVLRHRPGADITVADVAAVYRTVKPEWIKVSANGKNAVLVQLFQQPDGDTIHIAAQVDAMLDTIRQTLPADSELQVWYDQSLLVSQSAFSVGDAMITGVLLAAIVLFAFLRSFKTILIAILVVPVTLALTILLLKATGLSFNIMTLGGMAAAIGLIIDDAIVMIEHIISCIRKNTESVRHSIFLAATEISKPLTGSSLATIIIFCPLAFLDGVTGAFFKALSLTMAFSLIVSFLIAWLCIPLLAGSLFSENDAQADDSGPVTRCLLKWYQNGFHTLSRKPLLLLFVIAGLLCLSAVSYTKVGTGFMPTMDEGGFVLDYRANAGTSLEETDRQIRQLETLIRQTPEVESYSRRTGAGLGGGLSEANEGDFFIKLKPFPRAPVDEVMSKLRSQIASNLPGLEVELILLMEDLIGDLTSVPQPIEIKLYSDNTEALLSTAPKIAELISKTKGVVDINDGVTIAGDSFNFTINETKAAQFGVTRQWIAAQIGNLFEGTVATTINESLKSVDVRVWPALNHRQNVNSLENYWAAGTGGTPIPLAEVVSIKKIRGEPQITRENLKRMVAVTARIEGRDMGSTVTEIEKLLNIPGTLPDKMYYQMGGLYAQQQQSFTGLMYVFTAALAILFALILFLYEDILIAISIMGTSLLAVGCVFTGLWFTGTDLNITAMMGMTMILGIVTEVAVFFYSEYQAILTEKSDWKEALWQAGSNRLRPIMMTTLAAIMALAPLAFAMTTGSEMQQPLAIAIISGLLVQLPLVLMISPAVYIFLRQIQDK